VIAAYAPPPTASGAANAGGRVARLCGDAETTVIEHPEAAEPFYGVAADGDTVWAVSARTLYRLSPKGQDAIPIGEWGWLSDLRVIRAAPGAWLVQTTLNQHFTAAGLTPLVVATP
jgi:hypothetical protein